MEQNRTRTLHVGVLNVRSAKDETKQKQIHKLIVDRKLDLLLLTETWLSAADEDRFRYNMPSGYRTKHQTRPPGPGGEVIRGGGVAIVYRSDLDVSEPEVEEYTFAKKFLELLVVKLHTRRGRINIAAVYRPPYRPPSSGTPCQGFTPRQFCNNHLPEYLDKLLFLDGELLLCGDMNCPGKDDTMIDQLVKDLLSKRQLVQCVVGPTHNDKKGKNNTLDVLITEKDSTLSTKPIVIKDIEVKSDHYLVLFELNVGPESALRLEGQFSRFLERCIAIVISSVRLSL